MNILNNFKLTDKQEDHDVVAENIRDSVSFKGTNLWILIFAIFIASLGLNINSTAVVIGAMLVSPLMGPIIGLGFGMAVNDLSLLKKSISSWLFAAGIGLTTSYIYFLLSPINIAHSEILARTSPTIYDVLIAVFGGFAGILAVSSKLKGNVIPGVAIATALMPPLCTAGYGLATLQFNFFFGALYLFLINTVFIALTTLVSTRFLKFPFKKLPQKKDEIKTRRIVWGISIITLLPSIYFGYDMVQQNKFEQNVRLFLENEAVFPNDYLLNKKIDAKNKNITLTYGGEIIEEKEISNLKSKLPKYDLGNTTLKIQQGFSYLNNKENDDQTNTLTLALSDKEIKIKQLQTKVDSLRSQKQLSKQVFIELKTQYPEIKSFIFQEAVNQTDSTQQKIWIAIIHSGNELNIKEKTKIEDYLKVRINIENLNTYFQ